MIITAQSWKKLFLFALGLAAGVSFCMKWMESDFVTDDGQFTILGLELFYTRKKLAAVLAGLPAPAAMALRYHLWFDFAFITGVYPGIAALCMIGREKAGGRWFRRLLYSLALLQLVAWAADIIENRYLLQWIVQPHINEAAFQQYHGIVIGKWTIVIVSLLIAIPAALWKKKKR